MKKQILNLGKALSKAEQKQVLGGYIPEFGQCKIFFSNSDGQTHNETHTFLYEPSPDDSNWANNRCLEGMALGWSACSYDCNHDGWGN